MSSNVKRSEFLDRFAGTELDVSSFSEATWEYLEAAGLKRSRLLKIAGRDGIIRDRAELQQLYQVIDSFDRNGRSSSFVLAQPTRSGTAGALTPAGKIFTKLVNERRASERIDKKAFVARFEQGEIDLRKLTPEQQARLSALGLDLKGLKKAADGDGCFASRQRLQSLFELIEAKLDRNGDSATIDTTGPAPLGTPSAQAPKSKAGEAIDILASLNTPYEQGFRSYDNLERAATVREEQGLVSFDNLERAAIAEEEQGLASFDNLERTAMEQEEQGVPLYGLAVTTQEKPISVPDLKVAHITQPDATACYLTSEAMIRKFSRKAGSMLNKETKDKSQAHHMGRVDSGQGAVAGRKRDFEAGRKYIDACLTRGRPVLVGVSHKGLLQMKEAYNFDKLTDHFIVIIGAGVDAEGRIYYTYHDPGTSGKYKTARLYVDKDTDMLFRPGFPDATGGRRHQYQATQVRTYRDIPFEDITGQNPTKRPE